MNVQITEIRNPAAVGWRWFADSGTEYEITWPRETHTLLFGINGGNGWMTTTLVRPERYGFAGTLKTARAAVKAFIDDVLDKDDRELT